MTTKMNDFTDLKHAQERDHTITFKDESKRCYVTRGKGCFLFLLAAAACVIVGVCVFYLHPKYDRNGDDDSKSREAVCDDVTPTTPAVDATTASTPPADVRLPLTLRPQHYNLHLRPDIYQQNSADFAFTGKHKW